MLRVYGGRCVWVRVGANARSGGERLLRVERCEFSMSESEMEFKCCIMVKLNSKKIIQMEGDGCRR